MANGSLFTLDKDFYKNNKALLDAEFARRGYSFVFGEGSKEQIEATNASADKEKAAYEKRMATFENEQRA
jgi:hypothetical protein